MGEREGLFLPPRDNTTRTHKTPMNTAADDIYMCGNRLTMYNRIPGAKSLATQLLPRPGSSAIMGLGLGLGLLLLLSSWILS